jgi:hypothetical protein
MPIWLRKFTFNKIREHFQQANEEKAPTPAKTKTSIARPNIKPSYSTKASK